ncbi:MAG: HD domain-containing protein [Pirellulales bacterium]|nr:HD domain-containing protein [Pirellulales bacterium]
MSQREMQIVELADMTSGQEADVFVLMTAKEQLTTRDGKPYFRVSFRDARREVSFPIWGDSPLAVDCRDAWVPGTHYKIRGTYRETDYGPQLDIRRIREVTEADADDGFSPTMCMAHSRFDPEAMLAELLELVQSHVEDPGLRSLVQWILSENHEALLTMPAARRNHHAYVGGLLEHTLSVTKTCVYLAEKYEEHYPDMHPPLDKSMTVAGAVLHDIGKLRELEQNAAAAEYTAAGHMVGHMLLGRDMVREAAAKLEDKGDVSVDAETLLRLEHLVLSHQRLPEWGSPKPPMTPEAMIVHYADDLDAKLHMMVSILEEDSGSGMVTSTKNVLRQQVFKGFS